jgi:hypothetical protein
MTEVVSFWRDELGHDGVLLLDTIDYSWNFDPQVAQRLLDHDADPLGGAPAIVFANHRYARRDCSATRSGRSGRTSSPARGRLPHRRDGVRAVDRARLRAAGPLERRLAEHVSSVAVPAA